MKRTWAPTSIFVSYSVKEQKADFIADSRNETDMGARFRFRQLFRKRARSGLYNGFAE